ncbi:MAG: carbamoyltransferase [Candidatus Schekmanbacteria bacterium]|nr:carbamoyltransferase [Candidatus Schekmanbacteria bacterium]
MNILGISCFYHDSSAALFQDGELVAAASEERFTRKKHDSDFPSRAVEYCLKEAGIAPAKLDYVGYYERPFVKFERILKTYIATWPYSYRSFSKAIPLWLKEKLWIPRIIRRELGAEQKVLFVEHHLAHAASAFLLSPFAESAILTFDGVGEWSTATRGVGHGCNIEIADEIRFPHSLGLLYTAFTYYLGFTVNDAEYKVMGLAPYGEPKYVGLIRDNLIEIRADGSFRLNLDHFGYIAGLRMTNERFHSLFGMLPREPESKLEQAHKDIARSLQVVTEEVMLKSAIALRQRTGARNLCMAGGVALNCVANGRILREAGYDDLFVQPAAGDGGGAVGVAAYIHATLLKQGRPRPLADVFLGPQYSADEIAAALQAEGGECVSATRLEREALIAATVDAIEAGRVVGWFQGRMEFGPRALGSRSILADPRDPANRDIVNLKIKFRESFRPFAPVVLEENLSDWFDLDRETPYMLLVADVHAAKRVIPAVTHVDGSARIQSIRRQQNPLYYDVVAEFGRRTGVPVLINTSFNVRSEPIVCTPADAVRCFLRTGMDDLIIGPYHVVKTPQAPEPKAPEARAALDRAGRERRSALAAVNGG